MAQFKKSCSIRLIISKFYSKQSQKKKLPDYYNNYISKIANMVTMVIIVNMASIINIIDKVDNINIINIGTFNKS